jgi:hypothetical protein
MEEFLKEAFKTDDIKNISPEKVEAFVERQNSLIPRINYRRGVGKALMGRKPIVVLTKNVEQKEVKGMSQAQFNQRNPNIGFK